MAVGRYDDDMRDNQKLVNAGDRAAWLWWCGVMYCRRALTDGFIPTAQLPYLFRGAIAPRNSAAALVRERLWHETSGGYRIHDYLKWNPSKAHVEAYREKERNRKRDKGGDSMPDSSMESSAESALDSARGGWTSSDPPSVTRAGALSSPLLSAGVSGSDAEVQDPDPSRAREPRWGARSTRQTPLTRSSDHLRCNPLAAAACGRGICVPAFLVAQWSQQFGDDLAAAAVEVRAAVLDGLAVLRDGPVGDDPLKFWRGIWQSRHGSQAPTSRATRRQAEVTASDWFEECKVLHAGACEGRYAHETKMAIDANPEGQPA